MIEQEIRLDRATGRKETGVDGRENAGGVQRRIVTVCSLKGGVGCSTLSAGLAAAFARMGRKTLAVDLDGSLHSLDFFFGMQDRILFGLPSYISGKIDAERLLCRDETLENLYVCISSEGDEGGSAGMPEAIAALAGKEGFEVVILDLPGREAALAGACAQISDDLLIVTGQDAPSVLAAEKAAEELEGFPAKRHLVIDRFDISDLSSYAQGRARAIDIVDQSRLPLLGIVPESYSILRRTGEGLLSSLPETEPDAPFMNIAARLEGGNVPLFEGCGGERIRKKL